MSKSHFGSPPEGPPRRLIGGAKAPEPPFPVLPLRTGVLFPGTVLTLPVGRERSVALLRTVYTGDVIGVVTQRDPKHDNPTTSDLHSVGTFARIVRLEKSGPNELQLAIEGIGRFTLDSLVRSDPFWLAEGAVADDVNGEGDEAKERMEAIRARILELGGTGALAQVAASEGPAGVFADRVAAALDLPNDREMEVLAELDVVARLRKVGDLLNEAKARTDVRKKIESEVRKELGKGQREAILREQMRAIQRELGEEGAREEEVDRLKKRLDEAQLSEEARTVADRELRRLEALSPQHAEYGVIKNYLEWIADLPWGKRAPASRTTSKARSSASDSPESREGESQSTIDLDAIAAKLDADHHGLDDVKKRILEHMAVLKLAGSDAPSADGRRSASILCLAGPPGVGKTSIGQSIADATGRPLVRIALGGVGDEAELRGHRRTYVGALPGRILNALKKAKVKNPVLLLDEIDKLGHGWRGSPESALLEILDPEQNKTFQDHYLELPFDLGEVLFICTANDLGQLSPPLRDRLEIIEISGYTLEEKLHIAKGHLLPKQLAAHKISGGSLSVTDAALTAMIRDYTREAGVRQLNREITKLCRALALLHARSPRRAEGVAARDDGKLPKLVVDESDLVEHLGKAKFFSEIAERTSVPGVATGLAWTPVGGDILFIETSRMPGKGRLEITGQLGDVMKESAKAALTYVRSHADDLGIDPTVMEREDLHVHVPAGAVPKDGPSAGVTMFTALTSLLSGRRVRPDTAMTGEVTLRGRVLPVGGIKSKVLAARRAGITRVILPAKNARDLEDVPREARATMEFVLADEVKQVLDAALEPLPTPVGSRDTTSGDRPHV